MDIQENDLKHYGILGMRWGTRRGNLERRQTMLTKKRQNALDKRDLNRLERKKSGSSHQKNLDSKKIAVLKERVAKVKNEKISDVEKKPGWSKKKKIIVSAIAAYGIYHITATAAYVYQAKKMGFL